MELYSTIAHCYVKQDCPVEANKYLQKALQCIDSNTNFRMKQMREKLQNERSNIQRDFIESRFSRTEAWKCSYPLPPQTSNRPKVEEDVPLTNKRKRKKTGKADDLEIQFKLLSVKDIILRS